MKPCQVLECMRTGSESFPEGGVDYWVCGDHGFALRAGEHHYADREESVVYLGDAAYPSLIGATERISRGNENSVWTLEFGRNGIATGEVTFMVPSRLRLSVTNAEVAHESSDGGNA